MEERPDITAGQRELAGVWANSVEVNRSQQEFTLDFIRLDHGQRPPRRGVLVARVALSPGLVPALMDLLQTQWTGRQRIRPIRRGDFVTFRYPPRRTVPSTPFTEQARKDLEKIRAHEIEQAKKRFGR